MDRDDRHDASMRQNFILVNEFTEEGVERFKSNFERLLSTSLPIIPIYIDSFGGEIYSLNAMIDIMNSTDVPIATIAMGKAMSCGSILLSCGTKGLRFMGEYSTVMIHDAASYSHGKIEDLKVDVVEAERLNTMILHLLAKNCGKSPDYFKKHISSRAHANWYLNAQETKSHGLIDHIGFPILSSQFKLDVSKSKNDNVKVANSGRRKKIITASPKPRKPGKPTKK